MLEFFLESNDGMVVTYSYIPFRDKSYSGSVSVSVADGAVVGYSLSGHPNDYDASKCVGKMLGRIDSFRESGKFEDHGFIIWS